jgi:hypothetical protein
MTKDEALKLALEKVANALPAYIEGTPAREYLAVIHSALAAPVQEPVKWSDYEPDGRRYPAVPDAMTSADIQEHIEYVSGWNDCRAEMLKGMK